MKQEIDVTKKYRTRSGEEVTGLTLTGESSMYVIYGHVNGRKIWWTRTGKWLVDDENVLDLIPAEQNHETLERGDEVVVKSNGRRYTFLEYESEGTAKLENPIGEVYSFNLDQFVPVLRTYDDETNPERLRQQRDNWEQTAADFNKARKYYRSLLEECGQAIGKEAYTRDDGTTQQDVLVAKVPELVKQLVDEKAELIEEINRKSAMITRSVLSDPPKWEETADLICDIMRDEVNVIDECEKWLRAFAPEKLRKAYEPDHTEGGKTWPGTVSLKGMMQSVADELSQEDYAQQAKEWLHAIHKYPEPATLTAINTFVDLILKAAKNESMA